MKIEISRTDLNYVRALVKARNGVVLRFFVFADSINQPNCWIIAVEYHFCVVHFHCFAQAFTFHQDDIRSDVIGLWKENFGGSRNNDGVWELIRADEISALRFQFSLLQLMQDNDDNGEV